MPKCCNSFSWCGCNPQSTDGDSMMPVASSGWPRARDVHRSHVVGLHTIGAEVSLLLTAISTSHRRTVLSPLPLATTRRPV